MKAEERGMRRWLKSALHWGKKVYQFRCDRMTEEQRAEFLSLQSRLGEIKKTWKRNTPMPSDLETTLDTFDTRLTTYGEPFYRNVPISVSRMFSENAEVIWVAMFAALVIRTFFFQPFRIPTCSMFPSFSGMVTRLHKDTDPKVPLWKVPFRWIATGETNYRCVAPCDGRVYIPLFPPEEVMGANSLMRYKKEKGMMFFSHWVTWLPAEEVRTYTIYVDDQPVVLRVPGEFTDMEALLQKKFFPQHNKEEMFTLFEHMDRDPKRGFCLKTQRFVKRGETFLNFDILEGDMVFTDRMTYHFRQPRVGESVVFKTKKIPQLDSDFFYIKRLVGREGDRLSVKDGCLYRNGKEITEHPAFTANNRKIGLYAGYVAKGCFEDGKEAVVEPQHLFVLGDNSPHSYDSRFWGQVPQEAVIGKAFFIMHPFTWRWGWSRKANPNVGANREDFVFD